MVQKAPVSPLGASEEMNLVVKRHDSIAHEVCRCQKEHKDESQLSKEQVIRKYEDVLRMNLVA